MRGSQTVDGHRKANVWRRLRNEGWIGVLAEENYGVEQQAILRRRAIVRQMGQPEVGKSMESEVVGDQVGEEVARLDLFCCYVEALEPLLAAAEGLVAVWKEESNAPLA